MTGRHVLRQLSTWHLHGAQTVSNEEGRVALPSSIDVRPIEHKGKNAYAQMDYSLMSKCNPMVDNIKISSCSIVIHSFRIQGIRLYQRHAFP